MSLRSYRAATVMVWIGLSAGLVHTISGQTQNTPATPPTAGVVHKPIPLQRLYAYFLEYQILLDKKADALDVQGYPEKAKDIRSHIQTDLGFTNEQIAVVRKAGRKMDDAVQSIQTNARAIIAEDREWEKRHTRKDGLPPGHYAIHLLQQEREEVFQKAVGELNQQLDSKAASTLGAYVDTHVIGSRTPLKSPKRPSSAPFHAEVPR